MKDRNAFRNLVGKATRKRPLRRSRRKSEDNIKTLLRQGYCENNMLKILAFHIAGTDSIELSGSVVIDLSKSLGVKHNVRCLLHGCNL